MNANYETLVSEQENKRSFALGTVLLGSKYRHKWTGKTKGVKTERTKTIITDKYLSYLENKGIKVGNNVSVHFNGAIVTGVIKKINKTTFTILKGKVSVPIKFHSFIGVINE